MSTWKPASSTAWKRPRRSTTKAFCCGTTTAVFTTTTMAKMASSTTTIRTGVSSPMSALPSVGPRRPRRRGGLHVQHHSLHALDRAPLPLPQPGARASGPGHAAQLHLGLAAGGELLEQHDLLPDQRVHPGS